MKEVKILFGQTIIDIAMQELGDASRIFEVADLNNISVTSDLVPGSLIAVPNPAPEKSNIVKLFSNPALKPASMQTDNEDEDGIEFWAIEDDFIVQ